MDSAEGLGDVVIGGLLARAVEPGTGREAAARTGACSNCRTPLTGSYCHECGQHAHVHRSLGAFWHDLLHGVLHFDGKIWRTLPLLALRPGELTRRYIEGERARFVSPMALFLFSVFAMFAVFSAVGGPFDPRTPDYISRDSRYEMVTALEHEQQQLAEFRQERAKAIAAGDEKRVARLAARIAATERGIRALRDYVAAVRPEKTQMIGLKTGWSRLDKGIEKLNRDPSLAVYKVQSNAYKFSWLLIPISLPFMWLLFPLRRSTNLYDHTVFVTYSIAAMSLLVVVLALARAVGVPRDGIDTAFIFLPPVHMFLQMRGAYCLRKRSAFARTLLLLTFAGITLSLFMAALIVLGALG